ncbi:MAG: GNAT family acetyltransferase [Alphaproteobacteria bacterium]|nr:GNAT family acetyltransferase [Alphaproteobacteria bacterium]
MRFRNVTLDDSEPVLDLWRRAGLLLSFGDDPPGVAQRLARDPELFFVGELDGRIVACVMGCYDGRRGWVNHLAVDPACQASGYGARMLAELERRLGRIGCIKINLLIKRSNAAVVDFYEKAGYARDDLIFMAKVLD